MGSPFPVGPLGARRCPFAAAYLSGDEEAGGPGTLHVWSGYLISSFVELRVLWSFAGPQHARFIDFAYQVVRYPYDLLTGQARRYLGRSPAGGAMVMALPVCLAGTVPRADSLRRARKRSSRGCRVEFVTPSPADKDAKGAPASSQGELKREGGALEELHGVLASVTLTLVALPILGVGIASMVHWENLVASIIHGRKRSED